MTVRQQVQIFTPAGDRVATVDVVFVNGKLPGALQFDGRTFVFQGGRYVETEIASVGLVEATVG